MPFSGYNDLDQSFAAKIKALVAASGGRVWIVSGFRSVERQQQLWDAAVKKYGSAAAARKWVAPPGKSNHGKGIAVDLGGDLKLAAALAPRFGLHRPMSWESWHFEPAGTRKADRENAGDRSAHGHTDPPDGADEPKRSMADHFAALEAMLMSPDGDMPDTTPLVPQPDVTEPSDDLGLDVDGEPDQEPDPVDDDVRVGTAAAPTRNLARNRRTI